MNNARLVLPILLAIWAPATGATGSEPPAPVAPDTVDVFFVGNSYVYYNNLAAQVEAISSELDGPLLRTAHHLHGGFTLLRHLDDGHLPDVIGTPAPDGQPWDVVVVQEHSRLGVPYADAVAGTLGSHAPFLEGADGVMELVRSVGARPVYYMTWAKEAYPTQTEALERAYREAGGRHRADVAPVGLAWARVRDERPDIVLFDPDGSHPSPAGTYLAACVLYGQLTGHSPEGAPTELWGVEMRTPGVVVGDRPIPLVRLRAETARYLQTVAWQTVQSSGGSVPARGR